MLTKFSSAIQLSDFSKDSFDFFTRSTLQTTEIRLLSLFNTNPDSLYTFINSEKTLEESLCYSDYHSFKREYLAGFNLITMNNHEIHLITASISQERTITYIDLVMNMKIPSYYEDFLKEDSQFNKGKINREELQRIENGFKLNTFSFDLTSLMVNIFNYHTKKYTIYSQKSKEIHYIQNEDVLHTFPSETLCIRARIATLKPCEKNIRTIQRKIQEAEMDMIALKRLFIQGLLELSAFQFRKEVNVLDYMLDNRLFFFLDEAIVKELDNKDMEAVDRDIREGWVELLEEKIARNIKLIENLI